MTEPQTRAAPPNGEVDETAPAPEAPAPPDGVDVAKLIAERDEYLDQLQRSRADYANLRRRTEQERAQLREIANAALVRELLPVLDDLQDGLAKVPAGERDSGFVNGVRLVEQKFRSVLEKAGVSRIEAEGQPFDPTQHDAVDMDPAGGSAVVDVYRQGYRLGQTILRPAAVKVGPEPNEANSE